MIYDAFSSLIYLQEITWLLGFIDTILLTFLMKNPTISLMVDEMMEMVRFKFARNSRCHTHKKSTSDFMCAVKAVIENFKN